MKKRIFREKKEKKNKNQKKKKTNKNKEVVQNGTENFEKDNKKGAIFLEKVFNKKEEKGKEKERDKE